MQPTAASNFYLLSQAKLTNDKKFQSLGNTINSFLTSIADHQESTTRTIHALDISHRHLMNQNSTNIESLAGRVSALETAVSLIPPPTLNVHLGGQGGLVIMNVTNKTNDWAVSWGDLMGNWSIPYHMDPMTSWTEVSMTLPQTLSAKVSYFSNSIVASQLTQIQSDFNAGKRTIFASPNLLTTKTSILRSSLVDVIGEGDLITTKSTSAGYVTKTGYTDLAANVDASIGQALATLIMGLGGFTLEAAINGGTDFTKYANDYGIFQPDKILLQPFKVNDGGDYLNFHWQSFTGSGNPYFISALVNLYGPNIVRNTVNKTYTSYALARYYEATWQYDYVALTPTVQIMQDYFGGVDPFTFPLAFDDISGANTIMVNNQIVAAKISGVWQFVKSPIDLLTTSAAEVQI
jgi:hypothetical protein